MPNVTYANRNKFLYGSVLTINEMNYFVPISSKVKKNQEYNLNIKIDDKRKSVVGSLRFQYMIPVPAECLQMLIIDNFTAQSDRIKISKELKFCRKNKDKIHNYALKAYSNVTNKNNLDLYKTPLQKFPQRRFLKPLTSLVVNYQRSYNANYLCRIYLHRKAERKLEHHKVKYDGTSRIDSH